MEMLSYWISSNVDFEAGLSSNLTMNYKLILQIVFWSLCTTLVEFSWLIL